MIRTKAAYTTKAGICEGGLERTNAVLERLGLTYDSWVSMQLIMRELGLSDTLFSFCKVKKGDEAEAHRVLTTYTEYVASILYKYIWIADPTYTPKLSRAMAAIDKRLKGHDRKALLQAQYQTVRKLHEEELRPQIKHWLNGLLCLLSDNPLHLASTHASIALMDGADIVGVREAVHNNLYSQLMDLLGPDDES